MAYRGRLINPMEVEIARFDGAAQVAAGAQDDVLRTVRASNATGARVLGRREHAPVRVPAQVEPTTTDRLRQRQSGDAPESVLALVFHFEDLERLGLVDAATGVALLRPRDRLVAIRDQAGVVVEHLFRGAAGGLYCTSADLGGGWLGGRRNLLITQWSDREQNSGS